MRLIMIVSLCMSTYLLANEPVIIENNSTTQAEAKEVLTPQKQYDEMSNEEQKAFDKKKLLERMRVGLWGGMFGGVNTANGGISMGMVYESPISALKLGYEIGTGFIPAVHYEALPFMNVRADYKLLGPLEVHAKVGITAIDNTVGFNERVDIAYLLGKSFAIGAGLRHVIIADRQNVSFFAFFEF